MLRATVTSLSFWCCEILIALVQMTMVQITVEVGWQVADVSLSSCAWCGHRLVCQTAFHTSYETGDDGNEKLSGKCRSHV